MEVDAGEGVGAGVEVDVGEGVDAGVDIKLVWRRMQEDIQFIKNWGHMLLQCEWRKSVNYFSP